MTDPADRVIILRSGEATVLRRALALYEQTLRKDAQAEQNANAKQYLLQKSRAAGELSDRIYIAALRGLKGE